MWALMGTLLGFFLFFTTATNRILGVCMFLIVWVTVIGSHVCRPAIPYVLGVCHIIIPLLFALPLVGVAAWGWLSAITLLFLFPVQWYLSACFFWRNDVRDYYSKNGHELGEAPQIRK